MPVVTLPPAVRRLIADWPLGFVATVNADGTPNLSPKGTFLVLDDGHLAFGAIRSPGTVANLRARPAVEVNFIDVFRRKGARIRGQADVIDAGTPDFAPLIPAFAALWPDLVARIGSIVRIAVDHAAPLTSPVYDDGATEEEMVAAYKARFAQLHP